MTESDTFDIHELLPHRYPFLLVDRIISFEPFANIVTCKNVTINEACFQGHFPRMPVYPGVLQIEGMAQTCALLGIKSLNLSSEERKKYSYLGVLAGIDRARFKGNVVPGDQIEFRSKLVARKRKIWKFECCGLVDGEVVCEASILSVEEDDG